MANNANQNAAATAAKAFTLDILLKATGITLTKDMLEGQFRGATVKEVATVKDIERISTGQVNSALRLNELFKILGVKIMEQDVQGTKRTLMLLIVQNPIGDQRAIYSSTLFRSNPTASSEKNTYTEGQLNFDRGILQGTNGAGAPKLLEKLYGNGSDYIKVTGEMQFETNAVRAVDGNPARNEKAGDEFVIQQRVFRLEHVSEADAKAEFEAGLTK